jgi:hypothetical protein
MGETRISAGNLRGGQLGTGGFGAASQESRPAVADAHAFGILKTTKACDDEKTEIKIMIKSGTLGWTA